MIEELEDQISELKALLKSENIEESEQKPKNYVQASIILED